MLIFKSHIHTQLESCLSTPTSQNIWRHSSLIHINIIWSCGHQNLYSYFALGCDWLLTTQTFPPNSVFLLCSPHLLYSDSWAIECGNQTRISQTKDVGIVAGSISRCYTPGVLSQTRAFEYSYFIFLLSFHPQLSYSICAPHGWLTVRENLPFCLRCISTLSEVYFYSFFHMKHTSRFPPIPLISTQNWSTLSCYDC